MSTRGSMLHIDDRDDGNSDKLCLHLYHEFQDDTYQLHMGIHNDEEIQIEISKDLAVALTNKFREKNEKIHSVH